MSWNMAHVMKEIRFEADLKKTNELTRNDFITLLMRFANVRKEKTILAAMRDLSRIGYIKVREGRICICKNIDMPGVF